jgi:hypothetical protein
LEFSNSAISSRKRSRPRNAGSERFDQWACNPASEDDQAAAIGSQIDMIIALPALGVERVAAVSARPSMSKISGGLLPAWSMPHTSAAISDLVRACSAPQDDKNR